MVFTDFIGDHVEIRSLLVILRVELQPSRISQGYRVLLIVPDRERRTERAVRDRHHDRLAHPRHVEADLKHQGKTLGGRCRVDPGARRARAEAGGESRELALDRDVFGVEFAVRHHLGKVLDDVRLRRDRIGCNHLRAAAFHDLGHSVRPFHKLQHYFSSFSIRIDFFGQTSSQIPQPLQ